MVCISYLLLGNNKDVLKASFYLLILTFLVFESILFLGV